jgi:ASCH domain
MKVLTISQPWAWAILVAGKDVENRGWRTSYRGPLAIHAGKTREKSWKFPRGTLKPPEDLVRGAIVGVVDLVDVVESSPSKWFGGDSYAWVLRDPRVLTTPIPCNGMLGLWNLSPQQLRLLRRRFVSD